MTKVKVTIEIEVEDFADFMSSLQSGVVEFSKETKANVLKAKVQELNVLPMNQNLRSNYDR